MEYRGGAGEDRPFKCCSDCSSVCRLGSVGTEVDNGTGLRRDCHSPQIELQVNVGYIELDTVNYYHVMME